MSKNEYRKKPIVVEAFQMTMERRWDNSEWPAWLHEAWNGDPGEGGAVWIDPHDPGRDSLVCGTLEGPHPITWGDFIIQGVQGELYPCKPDIFEATYEAVAEPTAPSEGREPVTRLDWEWAIRVAKKASQPRGELALSTWLGMVRDRLLREPQENDHE